MAENQFLLNLRNLPCDKQLVIDNTYVASVLTGHPLRDALEAGERDAGGGALSVAAYADDTTVLVSGHVSGWLEVACGRCLGPARLKFDEELRVTFVPQKQLEEDSAKVVAEEEKTAAATPAAGKTKAPVEDEEESVEVEEGDLDLFGYVGENIDLEPLVREQFVLAIPYTPLCKEDCKGLCSQCGADLNLAACSCPPIVDGRWEALGKMKLPS